jgi:plastocyanin
MAALVAGATSACGGGGGSYGTGSNMNAGGGGGSGTPGNVIVQDFAFSPGTTTVMVGSAVTWSNLGAATHHPVADAGAFDIGDLAPAQSGAYGMSSGVGGTGSFTFSSPGMYSYHCSIHPQMTGTITVMP